MAHLRGLLQTGLVFVVLLLGATSALGQSSSLSGTVLDPQGNAVAGAVITVTNVATGATRATTTSKEGAYQIPQLAPGAYKVRAEASGFKAIVTQDLQLLVSTPLTFNINFKEVGTVSETVTVTGGESILNTSDATIGNTFNEMQIKELPLLSRNVVGLLSLQPGVTPSITNMTTGGNVNGGR